MASGDPGRRGGPSSQHRDLPNTNQTADCFSCPLAFLASSTIAHLIIVALIRAGMISGETAGYAMQAMGKDASLLSLGHSTSRSAAGPDGWCLNGAARYSPAGVPVTGCALNTDSNRGEAGLVS